MISISIISIVVIFIIIIIIIVCVHVQCHIYKIAQMVCDLIDDYRLNICYKLMYGYTNSTSTIQLNQ